MTLFRVGVVGSGTRGWKKRAFPLGQALARGGYHLVTGGGGGVMAEVARGFTTVPRRSGLSVGILPAEEDSSPPIPPAGYPNAWVELPVQTHLPGRGERGGDPDSRNHLVVLSGDAVVALPGSAGTLSEVELALAYGKPVIGHLQRRSELPGFPSSVPLAPLLEDVLAFLEGTLPHQDA